MIQNIILPLVSIIIGFFYSKWIYKGNGNSFFEETDNDLFSKVESEPLVPNVPVENRPLNRRVTLILVDK